MPSPKTQKKNNSNDKNNNDCKFKYSSNIEQTTKLYITKIFERKPDETYSEILSKKELTPEEITKLYKKSNNKRNLKTNCNENNNENLI